MPRLFNVEVFNKTIGGDATTPPIYRTSAEFYRLFGSADIILAQILVYSVTTVPVNVTVAYQVSNSTAPDTWNQDVGISKIVGLAATYKVPAQDYLRVVSGADIVVPAYGRLAITADAPGASVKIIVCGRSF